MSDLVTWLRAQLDADERSAMIAAGPIGHNWQADGGSVFAEHPTDEIVDYAGQAAEHIAVHDPARVLRQVAAMRAIVDAYERAYHGDGIEETEAQHARRVALEETVEALATVYTDRDAYNPDWAPE